MTVSELKSIYDKKFLIFDLDNTIYDEKTFLFSVYKNISELFDSNSKEIYHYLVNDFLINGRRKLFNRLLEKYHNHNVSIGDCLNIMGNYKNKNLLKPYDWFIRFCDLLKDNDEIKIITNGNSEQQRNKIYSLNLYGKKVKLNVICANDYKPKPASESLSAFKDMPENKTDIYYLGDSQIDSEFCKNARINFINVNQLL